ncbi:MAG: hypothetical protein ACNA8L_01945 [Luteolibacter sp.]|jgi:ABC-type transport system involved in cytochrome bd biosynthesis fused ATPase/permease subunit
MWRILIFLSLIPPVIAMAMRWWFGTRVLATQGPRLCHADLEKWLPEPEEAVVARRSDETAHVIGFHLWQYAMRDWARRDPKAAMARQKSKRLGMVLPPFMVVIIAFALVVGKINVLGAFALVFASIALAALFSYLTLGQELKEVASAANRLRKSGAFRLRDDEDAVVECAMAHAWHQALPPVLRWLQGG